MLFNDEEIKKNLFKYSQKEKYIILDYYLNLKKEIIIIYIYENINQIIFYSNVIKKIKIFSIINQKI